MWFFALSFGESVSFETFQVYVFSFFLMMQYLDVDAKVTYAHRMHGTGKYLPTCQRKIKPQKSFGHEKYRIVSDILYYLSLEPINFKMFVSLAWFRIFRWKKLFQQTSMYKAGCGEFQTIRGVPGHYGFIVSHLPTIFLVPFSTLHLDETGIVNSRPLLKMIEVDHSWLDHCI